MAIQEKLSFIHHLPVDASCEELISTLKYNRTVACDMKRSCKFLQEAERISSSNLIPKNEETDHLASPVVVEDSDDLEDFYSFYYQPILDLEVTPTLKQDIIELLPDKNNKRFYSIIGRIQLELFQEEKEYLKLFQDSIDDETFLEDLQKEISSYRQKREIISDYLSFLNQKNIVNKEETKTENQLIYLPTPSGNLYINNDLLAIPIDYYDSFCALFRSIQDGSFKNLKRLNNDSLGRLCIAEVKDYQSRIVFDRIGSRSYAILSVFIKKVTSDKEYRTSLQNRVTVYRNSKAELSRLTHDQYFMEKQNQITQEIFTSFETKDREKIRRLGKGAS